MDAHIEDFEAPIRYPTTRVVELTTPMLTRASRGDEVDYGIGSTLYNHVTDEECERGSEAKS
jgi:hypothetical protein